jgi:deoxyadenosine/deoxycytidine kinase
MPDERLCAFAEAGSSLGSRGGNTVKRIEIFGVPGAGKTTAVHLLKHLPIGAIFERFRENPFWSESIERPLSGLSKDIVFVLQHVEHILGVAQQSTPQICDFSLMADRAFAFARLRGEELAIYLRIHELAIKSVPVGTAYIWIDPPLSNVLENIHHRGRSEEQHIQLADLYILRAELQREFSLLSEGGARTMQTCGDTPSNVEAFVASVVGT